MKILNRGTAAASRAEIHSQPGPSLSVKRHRASRAPSGEGEGDHDRVAEHERDEQVASEQVRPPSRPRREHGQEGEVGREQGEGGQRGGSHAQLHAPDEGVEEQHEGQRAGQGIEASHRIVRMHARPPPGRRSHQVRTEVIADVEPGETRHLGRQPVHQLPGQPYVECRVFGVQRLEQEIPIAGHSVDGKPRDGDEQRHRDEAGDGAAPDRG